MAKCSSENSEGVLRYVRDDDDDGDDDDDDDADDDDDYVSCIYRWPPPSTP